MGLLDKLHAKRVRKTKAQFAEHVTDALRVLGVAGNLPVDEQEFSITVPTAKGPHKIFLQNAFRQFDIDAYTKMSRDEQHAAVIRFVRGEKQIIDQRNAASTLPERKDDFDLSTKLEMATKTANLVKKLQDQYKADKHREYNEGRK